MPLDLMLWAATKADLATFAKNRGLLVQNSDSEWVNARGFDYVWWEGGGLTGKFVTEVKQLRASDQAVDIVLGNEFGFQGAEPAWIGSGVTAEEPRTVNSGGVIGVWDRRQGNYNVFTAVGAVPTVGTELDIYTPAEVLPGLLAKVRIFPPLFLSDRIIPDDLDPDKEEQWARSLLVQAIKNNGTAGTVAGGAIPYYEWDGVRILRFVDVVTWLAARGRKPHIWAGGDNG